MKKLKVLAVMLVVMMLASLFVPCAVWASESARPAVVAAAQGSQMSVMARPYFVMLRWIHTHVVSNWGWAIVVLTLAVNVLLTPVRIYAMRSQAKMQAIQPEMTAIRERYKDCGFGDPRMQEMTQQISALQKSRGVNLYSGFLPLLVQIPLLLGFYKMLGSATELRHASWLWVHDLAAADPWHLLPVLFVATMVLQQWMTPMSGVDSGQRKVMGVMMPLVYGVMTWHAAAGLALYWAFGNIAGIVQQCMFGTRRRANVTRDATDAVVAAKA